MRLPFRHPLLAALCAAGLCLLLTACGGAKRTTTSAPPTQTSGTAPHAHGRQLLSIVEDDSLITGRDGQPTTGPALATFAALGGQVLRYNVNWAYFVKSNASRTKPAGFDASDPNSSGYNWATLDSVVDQAHASGIRLYLTLTAPPPLWAATPAPAAAEAICGRNHCQQYEPSPADFRQFAEAVGTRYSGHFTPKGSSSPLPRVDFWSIWNEPNYGPNLAPQSRTQTVNGTQEVVDMAAPQYRKLLDAGWSGLSSSGHTPRSDTILIGETAPRGLANPGIDQMTPPLQFIRDLYCVSGSFAPLTGSVAGDLGCPTSGSHSAFVAANPGLFHASGWAIHPYPDGIPPNTKGGSGGETSEWADFARLGALETALRHVASAYSAGAPTQIYSTEFGYFTKPPSTEYDAVSLTTAARDLNWSEYLSWKTPWIASYNQYLLDDPLAASGSMFDTGLQFASGKVKPEVYDSFRLPLFLPTTSGTRGSSLEVWGCARPVLRGASSRRVAIQFASSSGGFRTLKTATVDPARGGCYFDTHVAFPSSGTVRLAYHDGSTGVVYSRDQAITLR